MRVHLHDTSAFTHPTFTGRSSELATLAEWLVFEEHPTVRAITIAGMAGIGKTQLISTYFARHSYKYRALFWFDATSEETLLADVRSTLARFGLPRPTSEVRCVDQMCIWLQSQDTWPWLLVLDNYHHPSWQIERFLAVRGEGHALLTTRGQRAAGVQNTLRLQEMPLEDSALLLLRRARLLAPDATLDGVPSDLLNQANAIGKAVGGLPLALDQIGAYGAETKESLSTCLTLLQKESLTLFSHRGPLAETGESHPEPLDSTYSHMFDELGRLHPRSADLVRLLAFLPPGELQEDVLRSGASAVNGRLAACLSDTLAFDEAMADLRTYSLIERRITQAERVFSLHPVVRMLLQAWPSTRQRSSIVQQAERLRAAIARDNQG